MTAEEHEFRTLVLLGGLGLGLGLTAGPTEALAFFAAGSFSALFLSPDLDLPYSRPSRRWGPLGILWAPYRWLHAHRGASHSYLYGPLSRLLFLLLPVFTLLHLFAPELHSLRNLETIAHHPSAPFTLLGYLVAQWAHLVQDGIPLHRLLR